MKKNLEKLRSRKIPLEEAQLRSFSGIRKAAASSESYEWLIEATEPIEEKYTNETFAQGDRIKEQLETNLDTSHQTEFEYQGSVTSDTHVKFYSDIDLLLLSGLYITYPPNFPVENPVPEKTVIDSLKLLRDDSAKLLKLKFPKATVDETKSKALCITGGSLTRDIDVVFCNWWNTPQYLGNKVMANRGIQVLDTSTGGRIGNMPFLHNWHIENKDTKVKGGLRKSIRLLKNLKYDAETEVSISSYDIAALSFNIPNDDLIVSPGSYLKLAKNTANFLTTLINNTQLRESLYVPNGTRKIFSDGFASLASLKALSAELNSLLADISNESNVIMLDEQMSNFSKFAKWDETRASRVREASLKSLQAR